MNIHQHLYDAIFFSPHLDDAVLSAGTYIASLAAQRKRVLVATVFTQATSTEFAGDAHTFLVRSGGHSAPKLFAQRKREDISALKVLGAEHVHLDYIDALFRTAAKADLSQSAQQLYPTFDAIFSARLHPSDQKLLDQLRLECTKLHTQLKRGGTFFAPLGIGGHIDHVLSYFAVQHLPKQELVFWEDVPYRIDHLNVLKRAHQVGKNMLFPGNTVRYTPSPEAVRRKCLATRAYTSQIAALDATGLSTSQHYMERYFHAP